MLLRGPAWIIWFFPVQLNQTDNWTGQLSNHTHSANAGLPTGFIVLGIWGIVTLAIAIVRFRRQDILNA